MNRFKQEVETIKERNPSYFALEKSNSKDQLADDSKGKQETKKKEMLGKDYQEYEQILKNLLDSAERDFNAQINELKAARSLNLIGHMDPNSVL